MQIDRYNHLLFPRDPSTGSNSHPAAGKDASSTAGSAAVKARPHAGPGVPADTALARRPESVVLKIQLPDGAQGASKPKDIPLYNPGGKMPAAGAASVDTDAMARDHQLAVDRNAGMFTPLAVNKDGVLVTSKPQASAQDRQPDFVALAVSAMREYSDEHDRQKVSTPVAEAAVPEAHWSALKGLQQFAAKLNVFA